jgi:hypothetical protein
MTGATREYYLKLNTIEELFAEPSGDPFDPESRYVSGIDEIAAKMRLSRRALRERSRLSIHLPEAAVPAETQSTAKAALDRYCGAKIAENQQVIAELRVLSAWESFTGVPIAVILVVLAALLSNVPWLQTVSWVLIAVLGIAVWVVLWDPVWNYVYAWRPNRLDERIFTNLRDAELEIVSE